MKSNENKLSNGQIAVIRTLWELAQARIDQLYGESGAEEEKTAAALWIKDQFPNDWDEIVLLPKAIETQPNA